MFGLLTLFKISKNCKRGVHVWQKEWIPIGPEKKKYHVVERCKYCGVVSGAYLTTEPPIEEK